MPDAIESRAFRAAARKNCIMYLGIPVYVQNIPDLQKLVLPTYRAQSPDGAVSQLFSTLVNMNTQIAQLRKGLRMSDPKPVPGVNYNEIEAMSLTLNGDVYFETARQYKEFNNTVSSIGANYGWVQTSSAELGTSVYRPAKNDFTNSDPVQAAIKGAVLGSISQMMDAATVISATDAIKEGSAEETAYFKARDRMDGGSIFNMAAIQYYSNTPKGVQTAWAGMGSELTPTQLIDGIARFKSNVPYMPTSITITPGAYVEDGSGIYPTRCTVSIQMANPLGGLLANYTVTADGVSNAGDDKKAIQHPSMYPPK